MKDKDWKCDENGKSTNMMYQSDMGLRVLKNDCFQNWIEKTKYFNNHIGCWIINKIMTCIKN